MSIENKVTIITGAAQGIGLACGERFAQEGARVVLADINAEKGEAAAESIRSAGGDAIFVDCDVGDKAQVVSLIEKAIEKYGRLDVMISNAAILHIADILELEEEDYDRVVRVNLKGFFLAGQAAARQMVAQGGGGSIINMSSAVSSLKGAPNRYVYGVTKAAVIGMTKAVAADFIKDGIRCNAICPGTIRSPSLEGRVAELGKQMGGADKAMDLFVSRQPMGRLGAPEEIAALAVYLASDESAFTTGTAIPIDGGWTL